MYYFYFLTIDRAELSRHPTKEDYSDIYRYLLDKFECNEIYPKVECYEYKSKGETDKWIHFHSIIYTKKFQRYNDWRFKNYSIKLKNLRSNLDIARTAGYIQKKMIDEVTYNPRRLEDTKSNNPIDYGIMEKKPIMSYYKSEQPGELMKKEIYNFDE